MLEEIWLELGWRSDEVAAVFWLSWSWGAHHPCPSLAIGLTQVSLVISAFDVCHNRMKSPSDRDMDAREQFLHIKNTNLEFSFVDE
jgi:hypothetical protein